MDADQPVATGWTPGSDAPVSLESEPPALPRADWLSGGIRTFFAELLVCLGELWVVFILILGLESVEAMVLMRGGATFDWWSIFPQIRILISVIALIIPISYLSVIVHEASHLIAGRLVGFWPYSLRIRSFSFTRAPEGLQFELSDRPKLGGAVVSLPTDHRRLRLRQSVSVASGPLASLLLVLLAWRLALGYVACCAASSTGAASLAGIVVTMMSSAVPEDRLILWALAVIAVHSALIFVLSLLPFQGAGQSRSDGLHFLSLIFGGRKSECQLLLAALRGYTLRRVRPRLWPADLVAQAVIEAEGTTYEHLASLYGYNWALDSGIPSAGIMLDKALATCVTPAAPPPTLALEAAYFEARHRANSVAAHAWLARAGHSSPFEAVLRPRAEAAVLLLEGQPEQAHARASEGMAALQTLRASKYPTYLRVEGESLLAMIAEAQGVQESAAE